MGFLQDLTGESAAEEARKASALQYAREQAAGNTYQGQIESTAGLYNPFVSNGLGAQNQLAALLGLNGTGAQQGAMNNYVQGPDVAYRMRQGIDAIDRSAASRGMLSSGRTLKALQDRGTDIATQDYGNYLARLMGLGQQGLGAAAGKAGVLGTGYGNLYSGQMRSAATEPQGMIAAANAEMQGAQNIFNTGANLLGKAMGSGMFGGGGFPGFGGGASSYGPSQVGPTYANGNMGSMGGVQFPIFGG